MTADEMHERSDKWYERGEGLREELRTLVPARHKDRADEIIVEYARCMRAARDYMTLELKARGM